MNTAQHQVFDEEGKNKLQVNFVFKTLICEIGETC